MKKNSNDDNVNRLEVSNIPDSFLQQMKHQFDEDPRIRQMRVDQQLEAKRGNIMGALQIGKTIDFLFKKVVATYLEEADKEAESIDLCNVKMSKEDMDEMMTLIVATFMCCDIIDTLIMNSNDLLHHYDNTLQLEFFNDLKDISRMVREKVNYLAKNSKYTNDLFWAYKTDDMYEMIKNKARAIRRKRKSEDWGKNKEKIEGK